MYNIESSSNFQRKLKKLISKNTALKAKFEKALATLVKTPKHASLKTHKINFSEDANIYSSYVTGDIRIIWELYNETITILLLDIGGHSGAKSVYK